MPQASYFLGSRFAGSTDIPQNPDRLNSLAWFCEGCGEVWARAVVEGATWAIELNRCESCGPAGTWDSRVAGSVLRQWYPSADYLMGRNQACAVENLPRELLGREMRLSLNWIR